MKLKNWFEFAFLLISLRPKIGLHGWILGHSPEKLKYVQSKIAQMEMFSLGKSEKIFQIKETHCGVLWQFTYALKLLINWDHNF